MMTEIGIVSGEILTLLEDSTEPLDVKSYWTAS